MNTISLTDFYIPYKGQNIKTKVPGDITIDFYKANLISNPYIAENYKDSTWIGHTDFDYITEFNIDQKTFDEESITITFKGVDLLSSIYINGHHIGDTNDAFLRYDFDIKKFLKVGINTLKVCMKSTYEYMNSLDTKNYMGCFNTARCLIRKAQCHFGWDWAPKICAYGIIDDVFITAQDKHQIKNVQVVSDDKGNAIFHIFVNYDTKNLTDPNGNLIKECEAPDNDTLKLYVEKHPGKKDYESISVPLSGNKNFIGYKNDEYQLWWPTGYGNHPLYDYYIELIRGGNVCFTYKSRFAFRTVKVEENPIGSSMAGLDFYINGERIFLKGSNWVPPECFTGVMEDEKYHKMINLAKLMNVNILRVWGGGHYEKDIFFDICDEEGILVWQDFGFACSDIPDDDPKFVDLFMKEAEYQITRLRNHPSLIYWCGGNEKTGTYGYCITHGDFLVNIMLNGLVQHLDGTRPYRRQSPHSFTDIGNDSSSGDSHYGNFEACLKSGMRGYRKQLAKKIVPFVSENAVLGPASSESLRKIFPGDNIWPINEMWHDRFMENPYAGLGTDFDFAHRELYYAKDLFGEVKGVDDFVLKAMAAQAEALGAESEYSRAHKETNGAYLNWMFDDIWPSGTWSTIDYYLEPKHAYYRLKRAYKPVLVSFYYDMDGKTYLFIDNQTAKDVSLKVKFGLKTYDGNIISSKDIDVKVSNKIVYKTPIDVDYNRLDTYLFATYIENSESVTNIVSPELFRESHFSNKFTTKLVKVNDKQYDLHIHADSFVKSLFIHFPNNYSYIYSDNYLDLEKGQDKVVHIYSDHFDIDNIRFETID